jgi:two-component system, chemotaxis family, protein-glutamate methylesterase/glutaminase
MDSKNHSSSNHAQDADSGFAGTLKNIQLNDLIQMCCLSASSLCMQVSKGQRQGTIFIVEGEIVHAACGDIVGEEAFYRILGWQTGSFESIEVSTPPERTIDKNYHFLVMEAARRVDEQDLQADAPVASDTPDEGTQDRLRVLIVDDSPMMRKILSSILTTGSMIDVVGMAGNGKEAISMIDQLSPDLVMLDVNMPVMDGTSTLKHIMIRKPCPVVIMSNPGDTLAKKIFNFLELGAVDFLGKPKKSQDILIQQKKIVERIKLAATANVNRFKIVRMPQAKAFTPSEAACRRFVIVISGPGGHPELLSLLSGLVPKVADVDGAVVALQGLPPSFSGQFAQYVNERCGFPATSIDHEMPICVGRCYVGIQGAAPMVKMDGHQPIVDTCRPEDGQLSIDRFLQSAASVFKNELVVVLLSGANVGEHSGLRAVNENKGRLIIRKRSTSMVAEPLHAVAESGMVDEEVDPNKLIEAVLDGFGPSP